MAALVELVFGVAAERQRLENLAEPLSATAVQPRATRKQQPAGAL